MDSKVAQAKEARKAASLLLLASARGYLDDVKTLLSSDDAPLPTDGAVADKRRATPAHYAAAHNRLSVLRHLWSIGAEMDAEDSSGKTPLHYAVAGLAKEAVDFLVATAKVWPGAPDGTGDDTPLHLAVRSGDVELVRVLLKAVNGNGGSNGGASELLKDKNKRGLTPLGEALLLPVSSGAAAATTAVASVSAGKEDSEQKKPSLSSSSSKISKYGIFAMADALFEAAGGGASSASSASAAASRILQQENSPRGWPLLHVLSAAGSAAGVEWLLLRFQSKEEKLSFVNERSSEATGSLTPLHAAAIGGSAGAAELLVAAGADALSLDGAGRTPAEAFEAALAAAAKASAAAEASAAANAPSSAAAASASAAAAARSATSSSPASAPLPLASAEDAKKLRSLLEVSSSSSSSAAAAAAAAATAAAAAKKGPASSPSSTSSVEAFSNDSDSFSFSFESPASTFKALPSAEQLATAKKWSLLDDDDALGAATSVYSPAAFEQAKLARGMRHARAIAQVVAALHEDEDFQEAAKLKRVREAVATVRRDPSSIARFREDPKTMDVLLGLRKLQAVCAANGRHAVPFEELVVESGARSSRREEDADRIAGLGKLHEDHLRAAVAAAGEDDPKEAAAAAERALLAEARGGGGGGGGGASAASASASASASAAGSSKRGTAAASAESTGLFARAKAVLAAASAEAAASEAAASTDGGAPGQRPFDWPAFWRSLFKAMAASLVRAAIAFVVLWMVMKATSPPPATVRVPPPASSASATEAEL